MCTHKIEYLNKSHGEIKPYIMCGDRLIKKRRELNIIKLPSNNTHRGMFLFFLKTLLENVKVYP